MKNIVRWFFVISSFSFLYWHMPIALQDNKVTPIEICLMAINALFLIINLSNIVEGFLNKDKIK